MSGNQPAASVLVCAAHPPSLRALKVVLRGAGLGVYATGAAEEALARAAIERPDAVIIDMDLGDLSGTQVCRHLREWSSTPLIVVSHATDEDTIVDAFDAGADDDITKPFRPGELVARVNSHVRRAAARDRDEPVILCRGLRIDLAARTVHRDGLEIRMTPLEHRQATEGSY